MPMQNPRHGDKWFCEKCHTWCAPEVPKCSWCGSGRPVAPAPKPAPKKDEKA